MVSSQPSAEIPESAPIVNRWFIPLGAIAVHVCIGSVYAWSTLNGPIDALLPGNPWWFRPPYTTFSAAVVLLGLSAAFGGPWVERRGPRTAASIAAILFGAGLVIGGIGLAIRQSVLVFLGMGVIAGIGCGLGYVAPVSALVKWFPDRRGMATGMAITGFGGGALLAGYLNVYSINLFGVPKTVMMLGVAYFVIMTIGARILRRPPEGWQPERRNLRAEASAMISNRNVSRDVALRTPQFYLLWVILFIVVTAGIGILAQASPMMQDTFLKTPLEAAAVVSLISIFNASGRLFWSSCSDYLGRRNTYLLFYGVQFVLFLLLPLMAARGNWVIFEASIFLIFTMYGGASATMPAFVADIFGAKNVVSIYGPVLTAWSAAAVAGPVIITELSTRARAALPPGASKTQIYDQPLEILAAGLALGFLLTLFVRPLPMSRAPSEQESHDRELLTQPRRQE
jgi:MFS family permease